VERAGYRYYVLAILILVYMLNFLDRQIIGILAAPLKAEFNLTDTQFGLMGGIAFASVYSTLAIPIAWLADRFSRVWIMTIALTVWSGFTAMCGMAGSFTQLFLCRMGVGDRRGGRRGPGLFPDRRLFPALAARPGPRRLRLRHPAGHRRRNAGRRPAGRDLRLAHRLHRRRPAGRAGSRPCCA
jgi:hypothetical protein